MTLKTTKALLEPSYGKKPNEPFGQPSIKQITIRMYSVAQRTILSIL